MERRYVNVSLTIRTYTGHRSVNNVQGMYVQYGTGCNVQDHNAEFS